MDTLTKRLAGPSTAKAGMEAVDQSKVNDVIYKASEGSKFFENERKKDIELTKKIEDMQRRLKTIEGMDLSYEEKKADEMIAQWEATRDLTQYIVHIDCDAFYASVEELDRPELKHVPMAVGGGVLTTSNYEARKYGVRSAMPGYIAKKLCPQLIILPADFTKYTAKAREIREVIAKYDPRYMAASLDEAYLNMTSYIQEHNLTPAEAVKQLRADIFEQTKITTSAGCAANTLLAKIGSNKNKPNNQFILPNDRQTILTFIRELPVRKINGIGKVFERILSDALGIQTIADIYEKRCVLYKLLSEKSFEFLVEVCLGIGATTVRPAEEYERKSVGTERTFRDQGDPDKLREILRGLADELEGDLERAETAGRCVVLKYKLHTYEVFTRQKMLNLPIHRADDLYKHGLALLEKEFPLNLRLMGLRLTHLCPRGKAHGDLDKFFSNMQASDADSLLRDTQKKRKADEVVEEEGESVVPDEDEKKTKCPCPICGIHFLEEDINNHLDICLNRSTVLELVRETDKQESFKQTTAKPLFAKRVSPKKRR